MNAEYEMAKLLREMMSGKDYSPAEWVVEELPEIKIRLNEKVVLGRELIRSTVDLLARDSEGGYIWLGRQVYLLPWTRDGQILRYVVIGGDAI